MHLKLAQMCCFNFFAHPTSWVGISSTQAIAKNGYSTFFWSKSYLTPLLFILTFVGAILAFFVPMN